MIDDPAAALDLAGLRTFVEALDVIAWVLDERGEPVFGNAARLRAGPFVPTNAEFYDTVHPDDVKRVRETREHAIALGLQCTYDARFRIAADTYVAQRVLLSPLNICGRRYFLGTGYELDTLLNDRRSSDVYYTRFRQLIEQSQIGVITTRPSDGTLLDANDAFLQMLGYTDEEIFAAGKLLRHLTPPESFEVSRRAADEALNTGLMTPFEKEYFHKNGSRVPVLVTGVVPSGSTDRVICFVIDLSEQRRMQQALHASEARYAALAELVPVMISISTPSGNWSNQTWERYSGLRGDASAEQRLTIVHPDDRESCLETLGVDTGEIELRLRRYDGHYRWFLLRWRHETAPESGERIRISSAIDIHDSRQLRAQRDEELLRIADLLPNLVWSVRADGIQDYVNVAWTRFCGDVPEARATAVWRTVLHPDDYEPFRVRWDSCFRTGEIFECEVRIRAFDRTYRWHLVRALPLRDDAGVVSRWFGTATDIEDHRRALNAAAAGERRYRDLAEAMPQIVWTSSPYGAFDYVNGRWSEFTGSSPEAAYGDGWLLAVPQEDRQKAASEFREALGSAAPFSIDMRLLHVRGRSRWTVMRARPEFASDGSVERWIGTFTDVDNERRIAEEQAYLADASRLLASSLDIEETLAQVAALAVPVLGDWCEIDLLQEDGTFKTAALAHYDAEKHRTLQTLIGRIAPSDHIRLAPAVWEGETRIYETTPGDVAATGYGTSYERVYAAAGISSTMVVPLVAGNEPLGAISYVSSDPKRGFSDSDRRFGEELARRAALSIANAQLYSREHRVADALQSASLPKDLPDVPGVEMSAIYVPGHSEAQIGGDWFDAFRLRDGRLVLSIGDVAGSGLDAAVTMSNMRQIIRGTAQVHADPVLMLNAADRALRLEEPDRFVTAFVGVLDPVTRSLSYASAGHHPPYVRHGDGRLEELMFSDLPLGLRHRSTEHPRTYEIPDNAILILYTDGLIESERDIEGGVAALEAILRTTEFGEIDYPAEYLREQLLSEGTRDDVAILTLRFLPDELVDPLVYRWRYSELSAEALSQVRARMRETLQKREFRPDQIESAQVVLGELASNVVRHAQGQIEIVLDFTGPAAVLHVLDEGPGFERAPMLPADVLAEGGRGLFIVSELAELLSVSRRPIRGSHARAVLVGGR